MDTHRFLLAALLLFAAPAAVQADEGPLAFEAPWIRAAPPPAAAMAGYVRVLNRTDGEVVVAALASEAFGAVEAHEMSVVDGVMRMRALPRLRLAPGASLTLEPGATHLMLMRPVQALTPGQQATIEFVLSDGRRQRVEFEVRAAAP